MSTTYLVLCQLPCERTRLQAAHAEEAVVGGQHDPVEVDDLGVLVIRQDVVERDVLDHLLQQKSSIQHDREY